ncbi:MAG: glycerophosphodiester phosphodiesterase, partial [Methylococcaceae bacterium]
MSTPVVMVIAHRGASSYAPENTIAAFDLALQMGVRHIELDQARQDFSRKLKWGPSDFSGEKFSWRLLPSAARVRPAPAAAHN